MLVFDDQRSQDALAWEGFEAHLVAVAARQAGCCRDMVTAIAAAAPPFPASVTCRSASRGGGRSRDGGHVAVGGPRARRSRGVAGEERGGAGPGAVFGPRGLGECGPRSGLPSLRQRGPASGPCLARFPPSVRTLLGAPPWLFPSGSADPPRGCPRHCGPSGGSRFPQWRAPGALPRPQVRADPPWGLPLFPVLRGCLRAVVTVSPAGKAACSGTDGRVRAPKPARLDRALPSPSEGPVRCVRVPRGFTPRAPRRRLRVPAAPAQPLSRGAARPSPAPLPGLQRDPRAVLDREQPRFGPAGGLSSLGTVPPVLLSLAGESLGALESLSYCSNSELLSWALWNSLLSVYSHVTLWHLLMAALCAQAPFSN